MKKKTDALVEVQARAAEAVVEYETVAKDKTLRRVKSDAVAPVEAVRLISRGGTSAGT